MKTLRTFRGLPSLNAPSNLGLARQADTVVSRSNSSFKQNLVASKNLSYPRVCDLTTKKAVKIETIRSALKSPITLLALAILTGCASPGKAPSDPLKASFEPYSGPQTWPASAGGFAKVIDGVEIYHGVPPRPYTIVGRVITQDIKEKDLVRCAQAHSANGIIIANQDTVNLGTKIDSGLTMYGNGWSYTTPATVRPDLHVITQAWIIKLELKSNAL
jgi:hypothetical protein